jgi:DNA-binding CsgD family transcriptional regulator
MRESRRSPPRPSPPELVALESPDGDLVVLSFPLPEEPAAPLTPAEAHVLELLLEGKSNAEVAARRGITPRTVANQVASLFRKLGVCSRLELVTAAPLMRAALRMATSQRRR